MDESEKQIFRDITDHYGKHDVVKFLNDMLVNAQNMARRLQAASECEDIDDERDAQLIAKELGGRLDMYASENLTELIDSTIITRASFDSDISIPEVIIISEDKSGVVSIEDVPLDDGASAVGKYIGLDFEVRKTTDGYSVRPMIIVDNPSLNYVGKDSPIFPDQTYMMIPLDCDHYSYTGLHDTDMTMQEHEQHERVPYELDLSELLEICLDIEQELNWGEYSHENYDECYGRLQCYLEEHGLACDTSVNITVFAESQNTKQAASELINSSVIIEKPNLIRKDDLWYVQLQFSVWHDSKRRYELYGASPRSILSIGY